MSSPNDVERFFEACGNGDVESLCQVLAQDAGLARAADPHAHHGGWTGLHTVARRGDLNVVQLLLERGADPNAREAGDNTYPLHWAAAHGHAAVVRALLDAGGDVHGAGDLHALDAIGWATFFHAPDGESPQAHARRPVDAAHMEVVSLLLARGARHHIFSAICVGDPDLIRAVVRENAQALQRRMSRFEHGLTPLHFAITRKRYDIVDLLIELGADLEATDARGQTALAAAMLHGDRDAMQRLQAAGAKAPPTSDATAVRDGMARLADAIKKGVPMIRVPDIARTLDWYTSIGFTVIARFEDDGVVNFGMVSFGGAELMFNVHGKTGMHDVSLWFYTDRVDELYQLLESRQLAAVQNEQPEHGIVFEQEIEDMFYGARQFCIRDLNGYELYFIQSKD